MGDLQAPHEIADSWIWALIFLMVSLFLLVWSVASGWMKLLTSHTGDDTPEVMMLDPWARIELEVW